MSAGNCCHWAEELWRRMVSALFWQASAAARTAREFAGSRSTGGLTQSPFISGALHCVRCPTVHLNCTGAGARASVGFHQST